MRLRGRAEEAILLQGENGRAFEVLKCRVELRKPDVHEPEVLVDEVVGVVLLQGEREAVLRLRVEIRFEVTLALLHELAALV